LARAANPLIVRAQLNLMVNEQRDANVVKKLDFSTLMLLSPVKGASSEFGYLRPTDVVVTATICPNPMCRSAQPILSSLESKRQCTVCRTWLSKDSTQFSLDPKFTLDDAVRAALTCGTPTPRQLALAGYALTVEQQQLQQNRHRIDLLPTSPLVSPEELELAQLAGVTAASAYIDWKAFKPHLTVITDLTKLIGNGSATGYHTLGYLSARGTSPMSIRYWQQSELLRAFKDARVEQIVKAAMEGRLLLSEDVTKTGSSTLSTPTTAMLVQDLIGAPSKWNAVHKTKLHTDWRDQDKVFKPSNIVIS
jgi:hypothetical protein